MEQFREKLFGYLKRAGIIANDVKYENFTLTATFLGPKLTKVTMAYSVDVFNSDDGAIREHANRVIRLLTQ